MAIFSNSELTRDGHALLTRVLAGECRLKFTLIQAGDGHYDGDVMDLIELVSWRLDGRILEVTEMGRFTQLRCIITNQLLTEFMEFREVGIRATGILPNDTSVPDLGEIGILFAYANAGDNPGPIGPFNGVWLHEEDFTMRVFTANATNISAEIVPSAFSSEIQYDNSISGLESNNLQGAVDELAAHTRQTVRFEKGVHGLRFYEGVLQVNDGVSWIPVTNFGDSLSIHNTDPHAHEARFNALQNELGIIWGLLQAQFPDRTGAILGADLFLGSDAYMVYPSEPIVSVQGLSVMPASMKLGQSLEVF